MYDELIKSLRQCAEGSCAGCKNDLVQIGCRGLLQHEAADAIEELQGRAKVLEKLADKWCEAVPKWIPVTERLPEEKKAHYLCLLDDDSMAVVYWSKIPDWVSKGEWTWHNPNWKEVTHWMPLPSTEGLNET